MMPLILLLFIAAYFDPTSGEVMELNDETFKSMMYIFDTSLVMFYAPWCGHCKQLKPEFDQAAKFLANQQPPVQLVKVDCTEAGKETCSTYEVTGYPTLKIFQKGRFLKEYDGPRYSRGIVKYMQRQVSPSPREITTEEDFKQFISGETPVVVGFFTGQSTLKDVYILLADNQREKFTFGITIMLGFNEYKEGVVLFQPKQFQNKFEPSRIRYHGVESTADLEAWLKKNFHGLVGHRTPQNKDDFKAPLVVAYYNVDYAMNAKGTNYWRNRILKVAKDFADDFNFAISAGEDFHQEFEAFDKEYGPLDEPVIFVTTKDNKKFVMDEDFSVENFTTFMTKLKANELQPIVKSEPIPEDNTNPVKIAVAKNFDEVVNNNGQDTMIEFYAPWCGHCKKLAPVWDQLGDKMAEEDVTIVKIDATSNDFPLNFKVKGFPTIYWLPKDKKDTPVLYDGGRNLNNFVRYISKHATAELKNYDRKGNPRKKEEL